MKRGLLVATIAAIVALAFFTKKLSIQEGPAYQVSPFPYGKNFAFTITDDPDHTKLQKVKPVYDFLVKNGFKTTVAVWVLEAKRSNGLPDQENSHSESDTLQREAYRKYILWLKEKGFEIAIHTVSEGNDRREDTVRGYEEYKKIFGENPKINIMHSNNLENIYWGSKVITNKYLQWFMEHVAGTIYPKVKFPFEGEVPGSPYFWGDILREKTKYVRLWGTDDINTLKFNQTMPYHDPAKPYVEYWFSFSDGYNVRFFKQLISDENIERLVKERGASIVYTHFAAGFTLKTKEGKYEIDPSFSEQMEKIARHKQGWFVPASNLLDRLLLMKNVTLVEGNHVLLVVNSNECAVEGITILLPSNSLFFGSDGKEYRPNEENEIVIEKVPPFGNFALYTPTSESALRNAEPGASEYLFMVLKRIKIMIFSHIG
ncbi:hypothetical protein HZA56_18780 [Candidatus Poribacteria bacterium]|nr:hypothetical protein [Candidatus Poribacteria bacterium]